MRLPLVVLSTQKLQVSRQPSAIWIVAMHGYILWRGWFTRSCGLSLMRVTLKLFLILSTMSLMWVTEFVPMIDALGDAACIFSFWSSVRQPATRIFLLVSFSSLMRMIIFFSVLVSSAHVFRMMSSALSFGVNLWPASVSRAAIISVEYWLLSHP